MKVHVGTVCETCQQPLADGDAYEARGAAQRYEGRIGHREDHTVRYAVDAFGYRVRHAACVLASRGEPGGRDGTYVTGAVRAGVVDEVHVDQATGRMVLAAGVMP